MQIKKFTIKSCCGSTSALYKVGNTLNIDFMDKLQSLGFEIDPEFKKAGLIYAKNDKVIITATIGTTRLSIKSRKKDTEEDILYIENVLKNME